MKYTVKMIYKNKFAVINSDTGLAQSVWTDLMTARQVARDLNARQ